LAAGDNQGVPRLLFPREHGTYGEILFPLVTALAIGRVTIAGISLAVMAAAGYLAHEGLLVLLGQRGARARQVDEAPARASLGLFLSTAATAGVVGIATADPDTRISLLLPAALSAAVLGVALAGAERTAPAELGVAVALASWGIPVAMAGGAGWTAALVCWAAWCLFFGAATASVRAVIARSTRRSPWLARGATLALASGALLGFGRAAWVGVVPSAILWAVGVPILFATGVALAPVSARHLRRVGWSFIAASLLTLAGLIASYR
jgi:hypothetical protein